ncbi:MAG: transposase [Pseudomonadota bacterium]
MVSKRPHSVDLKIKAVLEASKPDVLAVDVADALGIHTYSLYRWKKELKDAGLLSTVPSGKEVQELANLQTELKRLRKVNAQLEMENAVLKKLQEMGDAKKKKPFK